jgi:putative transposase
VAGSAVSLLRSESTARERCIGVARNVILRHIERYARQYHVKQRKAILAFIAAAQARELPDALMLSAAIANDKNGFAWEIRPDKTGLNQVEPKPGQDIGTFARRLSLVTVWRWFKAREEGGYKALLPIHPGKDLSVKPWHAAALELRRRPQGLSLAAITEELEKALGNSAPSYWQVYRFFTEKFSAIDQLEGRFTGSALAVHKFCHRRTADGMAPMDEVHADGWATHFRAPHPVSGQFVTLECWHFHDFATRRVFSPSVGLSESFLVIAKGLENCIRVGGVPAVWQTDSTGSVKNDRMKNHAVVSIAARAGITIVHPKIGNSQANGICENFNKYLDKRAKELATYQHPSMDSKSFRDIKRITDRMVKAATREEREQYKRQAEKIGKGFVFDSYQQALDWLEQICEEFNDKPHSFLPKIRDPITGRKRHQTPREAWDQALANGAALTLLDAEELEDLFRPHELVKVTRGQVSVFGQKYGHPELELDHIKGSWVQVAYDMTDGSRVWIKDQQGRLLCEAAFYEGRNPRPLSFYEMAMEKRSDAAHKRLVLKAQAIDEQRHSIVLEHQQDATFEWPLEPLEEVPVEAVTELTGVRRPMFAADYEKYEWLMERPQEVSREDQGWLEWYRTTSEWEDLYGHLEARTHCGKEAAGEDSSAT